jgi:RNA polymerase sigma factor (TIGR02999 family)
MGAEVAKELSLEEVVKAAYNPAVSTMDRSGSTGKPVRGDVSALLRAWSDGNQQALAELTPIVYDELRRLAHYYMKRERGGHSLQTTALVNEADLRLVDYKRMHWQNRGHFLAVSAQAMRRSLVDHTRRRNVKRGAGAEHVSLDAAALESYRQGRVVDAKRARQIIDAALGR